MFYLAWFLLAVEAAIASSSFWFAYESWREGEPRAPRWGLTAALARLPLAHCALPHLDNLVYGRRWKPRQPLSWVGWRR